MNIKECESAVEAILFANGEAVELSKIAFCLDIGEKDALSILNRLMDKYDSEKRGIKIIQINNSYQMCTNESYFECIAKLVKAPSKKNLTQTLLETLAIIAYKQPITKSGIEEIRGVSAEHAVNKLMEYGLVCEKGRLDAAGRPILFGTTDDFLKYYGYKSLEDLPEIPENFESSIEEYMEQQML